MTAKNHEYGEIRGAQSSSAARADTRGREADRPGDIPARGWLDVAWRTAKRFSDDNVTLISGGLAMFALLSVFPALAAMVSIYGMFATPGDVIKQMSVFAGVLPPGVWDIFNTELQSIAKTGQGTLTTAAVLGIVVALWSARSAMSSLMTATNIAYREREKRGFIRQTLLSLAFTAGAILGFLVMLALGVAIPLVLAAFGAADWTKAAVSILRVALLWMVMVLGLAVVYRYAPAREHPRWRWVSSGSVIAATLSLAASSVFAFYVTNFAGYAKTYGALGSVVVLLMWFFISSIVVVMGAEINAEMERQTVKDTTVRWNAPLGQRGAFAADTVGPPANSGRTATDNVVHPSAHAAQEKRRGTGDADRIPRTAGRRFTEGSKETPMPATTPLGSHAGVASDAGAMMENAAQAANPTRSTFRRVSAGVSTISLGARLLPMGLQLFRRYPVAASLALAGVISAVLIDARSRRAGPS